MNGIRSIGHSSFADVIEIPILMNSMHQLHMLEISSRWNSYHWFSCLVCYDSHIWKPDKTHKNKSPKQNPQHPAAITHNSLSLFSYVLIPKQNGRPFNRRTTEQIKTAMMALGRGWCTWSSYIRGREKEWEERMGRESKIWQVLEVVFNLAGEE